MYSGKSSSNRPDARDGSQSEGHSSSSSAARQSQPTAHLAVPPPLIRNDASTSASDQPASSDSGPAQNSTSSSSAPSKPKRKRITPVQLETLVSAFQTSDTPLYDVRERLANQLDMTNREVQVWFQNRRAKMARIRSQAIAHNAESANPPLNKTSTDFGMDAAALASSTPSGEAAGEVPNKPPSTDSGGTPTSQSMDLDHLPDSASSIISFSQDTPYQSYTIGRYGSVIQDRAPAPNEILSPRTLPSRTSDTLSWLSSVRSSTEGSGSSQWSSFGHPSAGGTPLTTPSTHEFGSSNAYFSNQNLKNTGSAGLSQGSNSPNTFFTGPAPILPSPSTNFLKLGTPSDSPNIKPELPLPHLAPPSSGINTIPLPSSSALFSLGPDERRSAQPPNRQSFPNRSWHPNWANPIVPLGSSTYLPGLPRRTPQTELEQYQRETPRKGL